MQIRWEEERCTSCGACERACPVGLAVEEISRSPECIRCGRCVGACPGKCLHFAAIVRREQEQPGGRDNCTEINNS